MNLNFNRFFRVNPIRLVMAVSTVLALSTAGLGMAEEMTPGMTHEFPQPGPEHTWLQQFVGEWESTTEIMEPGKAPMQSTGTESVRPLGGFWTISEIKSTMMDMPFTGNMTLGYDTEKQKYVGTWVDSMTGHLWQYEGTLDPTGKILTLETEGACPMRPGKQTRFRDVVEFKSNDHKVYTSSMMGEDGQWVTIMTSHSHRKP